LCTHLLAGPRARLAALHAVMIKEFLDAARVALAVYLVVMMFSMGLELGGRPVESKEAKRQKRRLLLRGLAVNLLVLPCVAVILTHAFGTSGDVGLALLVTAASPGGRFAPHLTRIASADLGLSVEVTLWLAKLVAFTAPLTAGWMLHVHRVELREVTFIAQLLVLQLLPYLAGKWVRRHRIELARRIDRPVRIASWGISFVVLAIVLLVGTDLRRVAALSTDRGWGVVLLFGVCSLAAGWLVGGPDAESRRALAISANARNLALALMLASLSLGSHSVLLATIGIWIVLSVMDLAYAELTRRQRASLLAHQ
jgi:BASS family bile acid:Na+ symporter